MASTKSSSSSPTLNFLFLSLQTSLTCHIDFWWETIAWKWTCTSQATFHISASFSSNPSRRRCITFITNIFTHQKISFHKTNFPPSLRGGLPRRSNPLLSLRGGLPRRSNPSTPRHCDLFSEAIHASFLILSLRGVFHDKVIHTPPQSMDCHAHRKCGLAMTTSPPPSLRAFQRSNPSPTSLRGGLPRHCEESFPDEAIHYHS